MSDTPRTPLREALDAHEWQAGAWTHGCSCGWRVENTTIGRAFPAFRDHREEAVRAALRGAGDTPPSDAIRAAAWLMPHIDREALSQAIVLLRELSEWNGPDGRWTQQAAPLITALRGAGDTPAPPLTCNCGRNVESAWHATGCPLRGNTPAPPPDPDVVQAVRETRRATAAANAPLTPAPPPDGNTTYALKVVRTWITKGCPRDGVTEALDCVDTLIRYTENFGSLAALRGNTPAQEPLREALALIEPIPYSYDLEQAIMQAEVAIATIREHLK